MSEKVEIQVDVKDNELDGLASNLGRLRGETLNLAKSLDATGDRLEKASGKYRTFTDLAKQGNVQTNIYKNTIKSLGATINAAGQNIDKYKGQVAGMNMRLAEMKKALGDAKASQATLNNEVRQSEAALDRAGKKILEYEKGARRLQAANEKLKSDMAAVKESNSGSSKKFWLAEPFEDMYRKFTRFYVLFQSFKSIIESFDKSAAGLDWDRTLPFLSPKYTEQLAKAKDLTNGLVSDFALKKAYALMSSFNLPMENFGKTMQMVNAMAMRTGQDAAFLTDSYARGISRLSPAILDNLGIQINLTDEYERYRQVSGKVNGELTKETKQRIVDAAAMRKMKDALGDINQTMNGMQSNLKKITTWLENAVDGALGYVLRVGDSIGQVFEGVESKARRLMEGRYMVNTGWLGLGKEASTSFRNVMGHQSDAHIKNFGWLDVEIAKVALKRIEHPKEFTDADQARQEMFMRYQLVGDEMLRGVDDAIKDMGAKLIAKYAKEGVHLDPEVVKQALGKEAERLYQEVADNIKRDVFGGGGRTFGDNASGSHERASMQGALDVLKGFQNYMDRIQRLGEGSRIPATIADIAKATQELNKKKAELLAALDHATNAEYYFKHDKANLLESQTMEVDKQIEDLTTKITEFKKSVDDNAGAYDYAEVQKKSEEFAKQMNSLLKQQDMLGTELKTRQDINGIVDKLNDKVLTTNKLTADGLAKILSQADAIEKAVAASMPIAIFGPAGAGIAAEVKKKFLEDFLKGLSKPAPSGGGGKKKPKPGTKDWHEQWLTQQEEDWRKSVSGGLDDFKKSRNIGSMAGQILQQGDQILGLRRGFGGGTGMFGVNLPGLGSSYMGMSQERLDQWREGLAAVEEEYAKLRPTLMSVQQEILDGMMNSLRTEDTELEKHLQLMEAWKTSVDGVGGALVSMREGMDGLFGGDVINMVEGLSTTFGKLSDAFSGAGTDAAGLMNAAAPAMRAFTKEVIGNLRVRAGFEMLMQAGLAFANWENPAAAAAHTTAAIMFGLVAAKIVKLPSGSGGSGAGSTKSQTAQRGPSELHIHIQGDIVQTEAERGILVNRALSAAREQGAIE